MKETTEVSIKAIIAIFVCMWKSRIGRLFIYPSA